MKICPNCKTGDADYTNFFAGRNGSRSCGWSKRSVTAPTEEQKIESDRNASKKKIQLIK